MRCTSDPHVEVTQHLELFFKYRALEINWYAIKCIYLLHAPSVVQQRCKVVNFVQQISGFKQTILSIKTLLIWYNNKYRYILFVVMIIVIGNFWVPVVSTGRLDESKFS